MGLFKGWSAWRQYRKLSADWRNIVIYSESGQDWHYFEPLITVLNDELAHSSLRFSFGRFTTEDDVDVAVEQLRNAVGKLRELSPLWDMYQDGVDLSTIEWAAH